ncbi:MAG: CDP-diacylglycerol--glycerol-3-phosphate 3-phosphatidyltransferase [Spirochaetes bacterium]|nr:MAG: CDP-diacylglycerol--glycerol-3-phosphate 3-phosphatidyltransferase [Spirochaetota bacterium]
MTLSDLITTVRIVLSPIFFLVFFSPEWFGTSATFTIVFLWVLFIIMEFSDLFDGYFARKLKQVSETGKLMDPFADSISRLTYFICFVGFNLMPLWIFILVLYRDVSVAFIRLIVSRKGITMSARVSGKLKAWVYAFAGVGGLVVTSLQRLNIFKSIIPQSKAVLFILFFVAAGIAIWSLLDYTSVLWKKDKKH